MSTAVAMKAHPMMYGTQATRIVFNRPILSTKIPVRKAPTGTTSTARLAENKELEKVRNYHLVSDWRK